MKSQPVEFLDSIEGDLRYAFSYYHSWRSDGREHFHGLFKETVAWIEWNPEMFPRKHRFFRRAIVRKSYFAVFFALESDVTTVVAVVDMRQKPKEILRILNKRKNLR